MNIKYNEKDKSIEIKEELNLKFHYRVMKIVMIMNLFLAILNLFIIGQNEFGFRSIFWIIAGVISSIVLYIYMFKHTTLAIIPIEKIRQLQESSILGRKQFFLKLQNGKKRPLAVLKSEEDRIELRKLFSEIGNQH